MTEPLTDEPLWTRLEPLKDLAKSMLIGKGITPKNIERLARKALTAVYELEVMCDEVARLKDHVALLRRIVVSDTEATLDEVKALEPGKTAEACQVIDLWNALESANAARRIASELRVENAALRRELDTATAALESQGRGSFLAGIRTKGMEVDP